MSNIPDMTLTSLAALVAPRVQAKSLKMASVFLKEEVFERGEYLLQNSILHFVFKINQSSEIVLQKLEFEFKQTKNGLS